MNRLISNTGRTPQAALRLRVAGLCLALAAITIAVFGQTVSDLADEDSRLVVLDGDLGNSTGTEVFEVAHPERFLQMGIAEQNMLGVAAGLATVGFVPVVTSFACFVVARALDSIRVLVAQPALNVKMVGGYSGLLTGMTGKTHQIFNDIAIMRTLANVTVLAPADEVEARQAVKPFVTLGEQGTGGDNSQAADDADTTANPAAQIAKLRDAYLAEHTIEGSPLAKLEAADAAVRQAHPELYDAYRKTREPANKPAPLTTTE